jgi:hypothetical protein
MGLDLRWPIGLMFSLIGVMLVIYGAATNSDTELYKHSLGININVVWGLVLVVFGGWMVFMAWSGGKKAQSAGSQPKPADQNSPRG